MAAANFSRDGLEMFYGEISHREKQRLRQPNRRPNRRLDFEIERNEFNQWLPVWKMRAPEGNKDAFKFFQKTKSSFIHVTRDEVQELKSAKVQFRLLVRFSINRNGEVEHMEHYFNRMQPIVVVYDACWGRNQSDCRKKSRDRLSTNQIAGFGGVVIHDGGLENCVTKSVTWGVTRSQIRK